MKNSFKKEGSSVKTVERLVKVAWKTNAALTLLVFFALFCLLLSAVGLLVDHRLLSGEPAWGKPFKFSVSFAAYGATLIWMTRFLGGHQQKFYRLVCMAALSGTVVELSAIIIQVARQTTGHFNADTPLDTALWFAIRLAIFPASQAVAVMFALLMREPNLPPVMGSAIRCEAFLTLAGIVPGAIMLLPDHFQGTITLHQLLHCHTIGHPEGGPVFPCVGWSKVAGDLRIAHFIGIHALQVLPLVGFAIMRFLPFLPMAKQRLLVWNVGFLYSGVIAALTWQAILGQPLFKPSQIISTGFALLLALSFLSALVTMIARPALAGAVKE